MLVIIIVVLFYYELLFVGIIVNAFHLSLHSVIVRNIRRYYYFP